MSLRRRVGRVAVGAFAGDHRVAFGLVEDADQAGERERVREREAGRRVFDGVGLAGVVGRVVVGRVVLRPRDQDVLGEAVGVEEIAVHVVPDVAAAAPGLGRAALALRALEVAARAGHHELVVLHRRGRLALGRHAGQRAVRVGDGLAEARVQRGQLRGRERRARPRRAARFLVRHGDVLARRVARRLVRRILRRLACLAAGRRARAVELRVGDGADRRRGFGGRPRGRRCLGRLRARQRRERRYRRRARHGPLRERVGRGPLDGHARHRALRLHRPLRAGAGRRAARLARDGLARDRDRVGGGDDLARSRLGAGQVARDRARDAVRPARPHAAHDDVREQRDHQRGDEHPALAVATAHAACATALRRRHVLWPRPLRSRRGRRRRSCARARTGAAARSPRAAAGPGSGAAARLGSGTGRRAA